MSQEEIALALQHAEQWSPHDNINPLRQLISQSTYYTYIGERSLDSFIDLFKALTEDKDGIFENKNIDIRLFFINSMKTQDVNLECMEEAKREEDQPKIASRKANLIAMIKGVIDANILSDADCKVHFSSQLLESAKVIPSKSIFDRRLIRMNTAMLYKQNKFNLLREDAVGYSALINDIIIGSIDLERDEFGRLPPTPLDRVPRFLDIISSHIGNFHLDPNRVLDILLDFFIKEVLLNFTFWIELFKQSAWIRQLTLSPLNNNDDKESSTTNDNINHSTVMAHLLGFKFEYYHTLEISQAPQELYYSCALLIQNGLIQLGDLLPYLAPSEQETEKLKSEYMENMNKEIKTNSGGLLAQYGALGEEGTTKKAAKSAKDLDDGESATLSRTYDANDIVELVKSLLSIGDIVHSEEILSKYNKLCDMYPVLAHYIYRLCSVIIEPSYQHYVPDDLKARSTYYMECAQQSELKAVLSTGKGKIPRLPKLTTIYVLDCLKDGSHDLKKKQIHQFFYTKWADQLETATTYDELLTRLMPVMRLAGYRAYLAPQLFQKLLQVVSALFERGEAVPDSEQRNVCTIMTREFFLPAISFSDCNPGLMANVWEILELFTFQERCRLYGEWGNDFYKKTIETKLLKARVERNVKSVMRRVSKNDVRQCGRDLGKLAHSNPTIVFSVMLDQIQSFDNLAPYMADACRYMSNFSYDILGYYMTEKWTGSQGAGRMKKIKMKEDGITSSWLRALSVFAGMLYKKQGIDPTPLIRYLIFRLQYDDSVADLVLFNEFVTKLCGIEIIGSTLTDDQITSAGCSDALKAEAFQPISNDNRKATKRVITRLKDTLKKDNAALELLVLLYRLSESCSSQQDISTRERVKRLDQVQQTILQYTELLTTVFDQAEYSALIPGIDVLFKDYDLPYNVVMQIMRPKTRYLLHNNMDTDTKEDEIPPVMQPIIQAVPSLMPNSEIFEIITAEFFVMFWQLDLYDIHCPVKHYEAAIKRYTDTINQCRDPRSVICQTNRPSVVTKMERQAQASRDALEADLPKHQQDVENTMKMLKASHSRWFVNKVDRIILIRCILQYCLYPRSVMSEVDAVYCYKFAMIMHQLNVSNFSSLTLIDQILCESLPATLMTFTDYETTIHARFIFKTFSKMSRWYKDEKLFSEEAHGEGLIGFQKSWVVQMSQEVPKKDLLCHADFKRVMGKWHQKSSQFFEQALRSGDSHQIRNTFLILRQFIPHFPAIREHGEALVSATQFLATTEKRDDLKVLARSYLGLIEKNRSRWVSKNHFNGQPEPPTSPPSTKQTSTSQSQPQSTSKPSTPRQNHHRHHDEDRTLDNTTSTSSNGTITDNTASNDRKRSNKDDIPSSLSSRSSSFTTGGGVKRLRSDEMQSSSSRRDIPSESRHVSSSSSSRYHRTDATSSSSSSSGRHSPRGSSSRGVEIVSTSISSTTREGIRIRDQARDAIREAARDSSSRSSQPTISTTSSHSASLTASNHNSPTSTKESTRESRRSTKEDRSSTSRSHHRDLQQESVRDDRRGVTTGSSSTSSSSSHPVASSSSVTSSGRKRAIDDEKEKQARDKIDKRYRTDRHSRDVRREKDRSGKDYRDKKRNRR
ncbi:transcription factor/nuclear export subunit protein 2-domain-containing protein [Halteromyces radiatus]|uniref:transcription factor/nuclear export subunit protein 2-domain-containing protein n=1 Tax=Halteromyces radiatus TaxID=101107 RepID=UPI00221FC80F|nr:transcription factor/nuclear export subunit protein 2-domain-containing protein [Halteromyces radiatus]KAI8082834.1 transcription factor/nuclear export subunit protein 2-domain-containing protein [Halteromyces radiatus]